MSCFPLWRLARHVHNSDKVIQDRIAALQGEPDRWAKVDGVSPAKVDIGPSVSDFVDILCEDQVRGKDRLDVSWMP
eukprot:m.113920 g.113920  ORF g.113920 m.113920 type:complete len:76 (+) comp15459_c0_seq3:211-438(+)